MKVDDARRRIEERRDLNAFISLTTETGDGPVVAVKDLVDVRGTVTTAGGALLPEEPAEADAPLIGEIRRHGCVVVGKTNLHEWAFGITNNNPHHGAARNPHDPERIPGGSSGGSAVAVVAGMCDWAVGSDTGGSIRIPAGLCGCAGFKPTLGMISTEGVFPLSRSLDTIGSLAPDVRSAARAVEMMSGLSGLVPEQLRGSYRLAIPKGWFDDLDEETRGAWQQVSVGTEEIDFPSFADLGKPGITILNGEAAALHKERVEAHPDKFGKDVLANLQRGLEVKATEYLQALEDREQLSDEVEEAMEGVDALLVPATPRVAPPIADSDGVRPLLTRFSRPFNVTGQPIMTVPAPTTGLPVGIQVIGRFGEDARVVEIAAWLEGSWRS
ncbi:MAG: amidase [Candidatus Dormibacteraeota bacterium]|nr:amidase [Candidatus Dormibacteraeota bacterium]